MTRPSDADLAELLYREAERYHVAVGREGNMGHIPRIVAERRRDKLNDAANALSLLSREPSDADKWQAVARNLAMILEASPDENIRDAFARQCRAHEVKP